MPIRPENRSRYSKDWARRSRFVSIHSVSTYSLLPGPQPLVVVRRALLGRRRLQVGLQHRQMPSVENRLREEQ